MINTSKHVQFICAEDWFFHSHFLPLVRAAKALNPAPSTSLICTSGEKSTALEKIGLRIIPFQFVRRSKNPFRLFKQLIQLFVMIQREQANLIHIISLKPVLMTGLVLMMFPQKAKIYHITGLGTLAEEQSFLAQLIRFISFRLLVKVLKQPNSHLFIENPDDLNFIRKFGRIEQEQVSLLGGAGVDPEYWHKMPSTGNQVPKIAFVGRMIWTKGVDILIEAIKQINKDQLRVRLNLFGEPDKGNRGDISKQTLVNWSQVKGVSWHGKTTDVRAVWRNHDINVVPTRTREGMPRAMLESAACGRPQIVTDVPGCRHFVTDGLEGMIVPPGNPQALEDAIITMINDRTLLEKMGNAARDKVMQNYTEAHVIEKVRNIYLQHM